MDKAHIVQCLRIANDLYAIEGGNPYSVRAHYESATAVAQSPLTIGEILALPPGHIFGVGRETLAMIGTLEEGGMNALLARLNVTIPTEAAELLRLPGVGPKTAHTLVHQLGIHSVQALHNAFQYGKIHRIPGLGTLRLARLQRELAIFLERKHSLPVAIAWPFAIALEHQLQQIEGVARVAITGAIRRFNVMVPNIEIVVECNHPTQVFDWFEQAGYHPAYTDIETKKTTTIDAMMPHGDDNVGIRLYIISTSVYPTKWMETTGDETHQEVMKGLLTQQGIRWTSAGLIHEDKTKVKVHSEKDIYALVGLPYLPPEIREGEGLLQKPEALISLSDIRGDVHVHSNWSDGSLSILEIARIAEKLDYEYIAITDHSQSLTIANGLTPERLIAQREEIEQVRTQTSVHILHGVEVDILADGQLDLPDEVLFQLDLVIASVHSAMHQTSAQMTNRILRAIQHPAVHIIGHLSGRILGRRSAYEIDAERLLAEANQHGVMFELNANPNRLDISEDLLRQIKGGSLKVPINTDAHHASEFSYMEYGIHMAKRGWLDKAHVLNALPYAELKQSFRRGT